jgi:phenylacetate-coenzyme A ligase PaaK-like adenylate-forming protein
MRLDELFELAPYALKKQDKAAALSARLSALTQHHYAHCPEYKKVLDAQGVDVNQTYACEDLPFIPVRLFKQFALKSVPDEAVNKVLTSSGTSGQAVSRIFLDTDNIRHQTKTLNNIISSFIGKKRLPLLLLDTEMIKKDRSMYSARGAGIIGFSIFGRDTHYALDAQMHIDVDAVIDFLDKHQDETVLMFGYTYMIWECVVRALEQQGRQLHAKNAILFHIGGWKKLKDQAVDAKEFNRRVKSVLGNVTVYNYYGMAEQLGSVFVECEEGHMHCSNYSDVIIRRAKDFSVANHHERGLISLLSVLPTSYPGHVLLTEDEGEILGEDDCACGRMGRYFKIHGRIKSAEIRGCSDTYEHR